MFIYLNDCRHDHVQVHELKQLLDKQRKELNECRVEITSLKMHVEGARFGRKVIPSDAEQVDSGSLQHYKEQIEVLRKELELLKATKSFASDFVEPANHENVTMDMNDDVVKLHESDVIKSSSDAPPESLASEDSQSGTIDTLDQTSNEPTKGLEEIAVSSVKESLLTDKAENAPIHGGEPPCSDIGLLLKPDDLGGELNSEKMVCYFH